MNGLLPASGPLPLIIKISTLFASEFLASLCVCSIPDVRLTQLDLSIRGYVVAHKESIMTKTVHFYEVYTNNFGSPDKFVQHIRLFRLNDNTIRVTSEIKTSDVPASRFRIAKDTEALHYIPHRNHVGYILEEYFVK